MKDNIWGKRVWIVKLGVFYEVSDESNKSRNKEYERWSHEAVLKKDSLVELLIVIVILGVLAISI